MATGTTRFDKFLPRDYSMEWFVPKLAMPNFEAWDETLKTQQTNYDTGGTGGGAYKLTGTVSLGGGKYKKVVSYTDIPENHKQAVINSTLAIKANARENNDVKTEQTATLMLANLRGDIDWAGNASEDNIKLHDNNTSLIPLEIPTYRNGQLVGYQKVPHKGVKTSTHKEIIDGREVIYDRYKVITKDGDSKYVNVVANDGYKVLKGKGGSVWYHLLLKLVVDYQQ